MYDTSELVKPILIYNRFIFIWMFGWGGCCMIPLYRVYVCNTIANRCNITPFYIYFYKFLFLYYHIISVRDTKIELCRYH